MHIFHMCLFCMCIFVCPTCIYKRFVCVYYVCQTCIYENFVYVNFAWVFLCSTCIYENLTCVDIACIFSYVLHVSTRNLNVSFFNVYFLYVLHVSTKGLYVSITYVLHVSTRILYILILHGHFFCMQLYCRVMSSMYQQEFFVSNCSVESIEQLKLHGHLKSSGPKKDQE